MIQRSKDILTLALHMQPYMDEIVGLDLVPWLLEDRNYALTDGKNFSLFECSSEGIWYGHYFCTSRGRGARDFGKSAIQWMFDNAGMKVMRGLTPVHNKAACWMARQLGLKSYGTTETTNGPHKVFIITKDEWEMKE